jgi:hypothetical protein
MVPIAFQEQSRVMPMLCQPVANKPGGAGFSRTGNAFDEYQFAHGYLNP